MSYDKDYKDDNLWLMYGDCLERMNEIPDCSVHAIISDIPYGIDYSQWDVKHLNQNNALMGSSPAQKKSSGNFKTRGKPKNGWSHEDRQRSKEYQKFCEGFLAESYRILKDCGIVVCFTGRQNQHRFTCAGEDVGLILKEVLAWNKMNAPARAQRISKVLEKREISYEGNARLGNPAPKFEPIVVMFKPYPIGKTITDCFIRDGLGTFNADYLTTNLIEMSSKVKDKIHETQKPINIMELLLNSFTQENHIVVDPFFGSGTTGVACKNLNRKFIGIEMDEHYFEVGKNRIMNHEVDNEGK